MSLIPYIPDMQKWITHFAKSGKGIKQFYTLHTNDENENKKYIVKLVTPTAQTIEQAKSALKRQHEDDHIKRPINKKYKRSSKIVKKSSKRK